MLRRVTLMLCALAATLATPFPARAANKDIERLQIQISSLQGQLADLQRVSEDTLKELKRLNESLAEQSASTRRLVADRRVQEEAISAALKDIKARDGIPQSEQLRRAIDLWINSRSPKGGPGRASRLVRPRKHPRSGA